MNSSFTLVFLAIAAPLLVHSANVERALDVGVVDGKSDKALVGSTHNKHAVANNNDAGDQFRIHKQRDVHVGACPPWGALSPPIIADCRDYCVKKGYRGGHCGSFLGVNCWCETS